ncbi:DUF5020 family protein [Sunxiuqinia sp. sy24]|uniref:DUF5020 family protein n=1 Tax=Sunxiuqinia sp. sy24 TaxID=3461495 RepID=UPI0040461291
MKKILLALFVSILTMGAFAQNIQTHYDLGKDRSYLTTTVEMFKPDSWGSTFFFIDMDYGVGDVEGISMAYWEIARAIKIGDSPLAAHVEYNGGFGQWKAGDAGGAYQINDCWLGGIEYSWNASDFSRGFTLQTLYKNIRGKHDASFQLTGVWYVNFANNKLSFTGFADFWREDNVFNGKETDFVFLAEPQLWYNVCNNFAFGSEVELSNNFGGMEGFNIMPTVAAKWTF